MTFKCYDITGTKPEIPYIGDVTLPDGQYDKEGTEHQFGDVVYELVSIFIDYRTKQYLMYFRRGE